MTSHRLLRLLALLVLARPHLCGLYCDYTDPSLETLQCKSVGRRANNILPVRARLDNQDTTLTEVFKQYDWTQIKNVVLKDADIRDVHSDLFADAGSSVSLDISRNMRANLVNGSHLNKLRALSFSMLASHGVSLSKLPNLNALTIDYNIYYYMEHLHKSAPFWVYYTHDMIDILNGIKSTRIEKLNFLHLILDFTKMEIGARLKSLNIIQSQVMLGDRCFERARGLRFLSISQSRLTDLPKDVFGGAGITHLDLSRNSLAPGALASLTDGMKRVNLSRNAITHVDRADDGLPSSLEILDMSHNTMSWLDASTFLKTPELFSLSLSNNRLTAVPDILFAGLRKLTFLDLSNNFISHLSSYWFLDLYVLETLDVSGNGIRSLGNNLFRRNANLRSLLLNNNALEDLTTSAFGITVLMSLEEVDVSANKLRHLPIGFLFLKTLKKLSVSYNRISSPSPLQSNDTIAVGFLDMRGNPWKCGCLKTVMLLEMETGVWEHPTIEYAFTDGRRPTCYAGLEPNYSRLCDDTPLSEKDYKTWEGAVRTSG